MLSNRIGITKLICSSDYIVSVIELITCARDVNTHKNFLNIIIRFLPNSRTNQSNCNDGLSNQSSLSCQLVNESAATHKLDNSVTQQSKIVPL